MKSAFMRHMPLLLLLFMLAGCSPATAPSYRQITMDEAVNLMNTEQSYGNIIPQEDGIFHKPEFKELLGYTARHRSDLEETLTDKQKELLDKMMDTRNEFDSLAEARVFAYGFKLGAKLMLEMLSE